MFFQLLTHHGPICVTQYTHPCRQQSQLQDPWHAVSLWLPYVLPASAAMGKCTATHSVTKAGISLFPRIPALVTVQQKQCHLTSLHVHMLRHQLYSRQVKLSIKLWPVINQVHHMHLAHAGICKYTEKPYIHEEADQSQFTR